MQRLLIILGLIIIPFYEIFLRMLPFVRSTATDTRSPKEMVALVFALAIGLLAVFRGEIKPFKNKFLLIIPFYLMFNLIMSPHVDLIINNVESGDFYFWKPFSEILCFALMIIAISSMDIDFDEIFKVMVICGAVMGAYAIIQKLGFDQFWLSKGGPSMALDPGANLGNRDILYSFVVMNIPLAIYLRKYWMTLLMSASVVMTGSFIGIGLLGFIGISFLVYKKIAFTPILILVTIFVIFLLVSLINKSLYPKVDKLAHGRFEVWEDMYRDIKYGPLQGEAHRYPFTGAGLGRFCFSFPSKHSSPFEQAHNDPWEFIYDCGLVGGFLLLGGIFLMVKGCFFNLSEINFSVLLSFLTIFLCSLFLFPFQLGVHQFYSSILVGILNNEKIIRRV